MSAYVAEQCRFLHLDDEKQFRQQFRQNGGMPPEGYDADRLLSVAQISLPHG
jgi:hypothetical protein